MKKITILLPLIPESSIDNCLYAKFKMDILKYIARGYTKTYADGIYISNEYKTIEDELQKIEIVVEDNIVNRLLDTVIELKDSMQNKQECIYVDVVSCDLYLL